MSLKTMALTEKFWFIKLLHGFPHIDFSFKSVNSTFDPKSSSYRESVLFLSALPVVFILLIIILSACCLCCLCVKKPPQKSVKTICLRIFAAIFIIFTIVSAAAGFFANQHTSSGVDTFVQAVNDVDQSLDSIFNTLDTLNGTAGNIQRNGINRIENVIQDRVTNVSAREILLDILHTVDDKSGYTEEVIKDIRDKVPHEELNGISTTVQEYEFYRWCGTIVLLCFVLLLMIIATVGCYRKSRCFLLMATCIGYLVLLLVWASSGFYLGVGVAGGDLCNDPDSYIESLGSTSTEKGLIKEYMYCVEGKLIPGNFSLDVNDINKAVNEANTALKNLINETAPFNIKTELEAPVKYIRVNLDYILSNVTMLGGLLDCKSFHTDYVNVVNSVCETTLIGIVMLLLVLPFMGLCMVFVQLFLPRIWHLSGKRHGYRQVDDTDPFCPRPPPYNGYGSIHSNRNSPATHYGEARHTSIEHDSLETLPMRAPLSPADSPPPATSSSSSTFKTGSGSHKYHPGTFSGHYYGRETDA